MSEDQRDFTSDIAESGYYYFTKCFELDKEWE